MLPISKVERKAKGKERDVSEYAQRSETKTSDSHKRRERERESKRNGEKLI